jgi:hypothetical protein
VGAEFRRADRQVYKGQTEMTTLIDAFRNFARAPKTSNFCSHAVFMCVARISEQRLVPYTALTAWFFKVRRSVFTVRYGLDI